MAREQDLEGFRAPAASDRVGLLREVGSFIGEWQRALDAGVRLAPTLEGQLNQRSAELQHRARGSGFGGLAHHLAEYSRLLSSGADLGALRGQLSIVSELAFQARQVLPATEQAALAEPAKRAVGGALPQSAGLERPPMITVARSMSAEVVAALDAAQSGGPAPPLLQSFAAPGFLPSAPLPPAAPAPWAQPPAAPALWPPTPAPAAGAPPRPSPPPAAPQFGVKNMLGLRAFDKATQDKRPKAGASSGNAALLGLPGLGTNARATGSVRPPLVAADASGLPPLAPEGSARKESRQSSDILERLRPERSPSRPPERASSPPKVVQRRPGGRGRARPEASRTGLWLGVGAVAVLVGVGLVGFFTIGRRRPPGAAETPANGGATTAAGESSPGTGEGPKHGVELPRERLIADDERFSALLSQVHGHGGKESPELRSLLNDQAALASKALSGKCKDGSATCKAWSEVKDLMVGDHKQPIVKRRRDSDTEATRSRWMAGLKMPGIPVKDDPRVLRVFEFYTQNPVGRETFQSMLFRCGRYRDLIQSTLIRYDLPPDLMALVFTESGCEPSAKSPVGAAGLWQFMPETGRAYHLRVIDGTIDERYSPFKATEAGIRMLADLRQKLGDWDLVFASYNLGPFGVLARVERAGGDASFWDLVEADLLPDETANYSPTVEAIALILANLQRLKFAGVQIGAPQLTADLEVPGGTRLGVVARAAAMSVTTLHALNLDFSGDSVPVVPGGSIAVQVPKDVVWQARDSIKELLASKDGSDQCVPPSFDWGKQRFTPEMVSACARRLSAAAAAEPH